MSLQERFQNCVQKKQQLVFLMVLEYRINDPIFTNCMIVVENLPGMGWFV